MQSNLNNNAFRASRVWITIVILLGMLIGLELSVLSGVELEMAATEWLETDVSGEEEIEEEKGEYDSQEQALFLSNLLFAEMEKNKELARAVAFNSIYLSNPSPPPDKMCFC